MALATLVRDFVSLPEKLVASIKVLGGFKFEQAIQCISHVLP
jgi:hypothetical protein